MSTNSPDPPERPLVRVHRDFEEEFPHASALATECFLNLGRVAVSMLGELDRLLAGFGITSYTSFNALTVLAGAGEPIPPSVVAKRMVVTRPTLTGILNTLERLELVTRSAHGADGRMRLVSLTDAGQDLVHHVLPEVHRFEEELFSGLDRGQQGTLLDSLAAIASRLNRFPT
ncbi:MAG: MarR family transcriptional regulator [Acidimicrobiales bacterium]|jgi:DNA-binding MarR family transcriptional regulator